LVDSAGELAADLGRLQQVLLCLQADEAYVEAAPLGLGAPAVAAVRRLWGAIVAAEKGSPTQLFDSRGEFELIPVRFVLLDEGDVEVVGVAVTGLAVALLPGGDEVVAAVMREFVDSHRGEQPLDVVANLVRALCVIALPSDNDTWLLASRLTGIGGRVVLDAREDGAYQRLTGRVTAIFHIPDPVSRVLYPNE